MTYYWHEKSLLVGLLDHHHCKLVRFCWSCVFLKEATDAWFVDLIYHAQFLFSYVTRKTLGKKISSLGSCRVPEDQWPCWRPRRSWGRGWGKTYVCRHNICRFHGNLRCRCKSRIRLYSYSGHLWNNHVCYCHIRLCLELWIKSNNR